MKKYIALLLLVIACGKSFAQPTELVIRNGHSNSVRDIILSPDKKLLATASEDGSVILWDAANGFQIKQYPLCKHGAIKSIAFSPDGKYLAAAGNEKVAIIDAVTTNLLDTFHFDKDCEVIAFTPNNRYLVSCDDAGFMTVWRMGDRKQIARVNPYEGEYDTKYNYFAFISALSISPDGKKLAMSGEYSEGLALFTVPDDVATKDLQQYAINIQAQKQLFILDACQSAGAFADMLSSDGNQQKNIALVARSTGTHWMAASGAQQFANEFSTLGHGAFTYVLLQALKGEAVNENMITVDGLKTYMQSGVPALMKKYNGSQQTPASYGFGNDFPVEIIH